MVEGRHWADDGGDDGDQFSAGRGTVPAALGGAAMLGGGGAAEVVQCSTFAIHLGPDLRRRQHGPDAFTRRTRRPSARRCSGRRWGGGRERDPFRQQMSQVRVRAAGHDGTLPAVGACCAGRSYAGGSGPVSTGLHAERRCCMAQMKRNVAAGRTPHRR